MPHAHVADVATRGVGSADGEVVGTGLLPRLDTLPHEACGPGSRVRGCRPWQELRQLGQGDGDRFEQRVDVLPAERAQHETFAVTVRRRQGFAGAVCSCQVEPKGFGMAPLVGGSGGLYLAYHPGG